MNVDQNFATIGLQSGAPEGAPGYPLAQGRDGALITQSLGKYYEAATRGRIFMASNAAAQAISVALATTYTGLCLSNEPTSGVDLVLLKVGLGLTVAPAAIASFHLIGNVSTTTPVVTHTTPVTTAKPAMLGSAASPAGKVDSAATIPTPVYLQSLVGGFTAAALPSSGPMLIDIDGAVILKPGSFVAIGALTAATGIWSMMWAECPAA